MYTVLGMFGKRILYLYSVSAKQMGHVERFPHLPPRKWTTSTKKIKKDKRTRKGVEASGKVDVRATNKTCFEDSTPPKDFIHRRAITLCESLAVSLCCLKNQGGDGLGEQNVQELIDILTDKMFDIKLLRSRVRSLEDCEKMSQGVLERTLRD